MPYVPEGFNDVDYEQESSYNYWVDVDFYFHYTFYQFIN